jgi:hypothetical protein
MKEGLYAYLDSNVFVSERDIPIEVKWRRVGATNETI